MLKYAKVIDPEINLVSIAENATEWIISQGYIQKDVEQSDITGDWYIKGYAPMKTEAEKVQAEQIRISKLSLTKREVFLALYKNKGITPDVLRSQITDPEALIEFDYAENYFRGNPLIDKIGIMLGYSTEDLDYLFENKKLPDIDNSSGDKIPDQNLKDDTDTGSEDEKPIDSDDTVVDGLAK